MKDHESPWSIGNRRGWDTRRARYGPSGHKHTDRPAQRDALAHNRSRRSEEYRHGYNAGYQAGLSAGRKKQ